MRQAGTRGCPRDTAHTAKPHERHKQQWHTCTPSSRLFCSLTQGWSLPRGGWHQDRASSHLNGARILQKGSLVLRSSGESSGASFPPTKLSVLSSSSPEGAPCSKEAAEAAAPLLEEPRQGSGLSAPEVPAHTLGTAARGEHPTAAQAPPLLLPHNPGTRMRLENKHRIICNSWKLTLFCVLGKHWVFHNIFKHKMFIFLFNLYSFSGLLVPLTLSVYKGWTIQAIAT